MLQLMIKTQFELVSCDCISAIEVRKKREIIFTIYIPNQPELNQNLAPTL